VKLHIALYYFNKYIDETYIRNFISNSDENTNYYLRTRPIFYDYFYNRDHFNKSRIRSRSFFNSIKYTGYIIFLFKNKNKNYKFASYFNLSNIIAVPWGFLRKFNIFDSSSNGRATIKAPVYRARLLRELS